MEVQQPQSHRSPWIYWVGLSITIALTLGLAGVIIWLVVTQNLAQFSVIVCLIAGIVAIVTAPLIFYFTIFKKPVKSKPQMKETETTQTHPSETIWNIPYRRNPFFTGREDLLKQLYDRLTTTKAATLTQPQAISGLGGIGKTQIAEEYVYRYHEHYHFVQWVRAATRDTLISDFATIADRLQLPEKDLQDQNKIVAAVKQWLATHGQWLLVFDNADDLTIVADFLPAGDTGRILLTTRAQAVGPIAQSVEVEKWGMAEGTLFLLRRIKALEGETFLEQASEEELAGAYAIVTELDFLPLALDQAGAYIEETGCGLAAYLDLYRTHREVLLKTRGIFPSGHPEPVATTWSLSFQRVEQANAAAADMLRLCAFLDPDTIPEEIFIENVSELSQALKGIAADAFKLNKAIEELRKFSLVGRNPSTKMLSVHRLVQAVLRDNMNQNTQAWWAEQAVRIVDRAFPSDGPTTWSQCRRYLSQAQACSILIVQYELWITVAAHLLNNTADYLVDQALYQQAEPLYLRAIAINEKALGPEHPTLAHSLNNLAGLYQAQGKFKQAEPLYLRAIAIGKQRLDPEHSDMKTLQENYARFLEEKNQRNIMFQGQSRSLRLYLMALVATLLTLIGLLFLLVLNNATTGYRIIDFGMATFAFQQALANRWISDDPAKSADARFFARIRSNVSVYLAAIAVGLGIVFPNVYPCFVVAVLVLGIGVLTSRRGRS